MTATSVAVFHCDKMPGKGQDVASVAPGLVQGKGLVLEIHSRS